MTDLETFQKQLGTYKQLIDDDIASYSAELRQSTLQQYGASARLVTDAYLDILARGGKRIRGALTMLGYEMSGGTDRQMIIQAARAIEMIHAYILIIDDIQDRSDTRRGGPSAHTQLASYHHAHHLAADDAHFGTAMALNAALMGAHAAQVLVANLSVDAAVRTKVLEIINSTMLVTAYGQTADIMNEVVADVTAADIDNVLEWKTAHYTFLNPLRVGMVLAGADAQATDAITDYAIHAGKTFQITDDILGTFGTEFETGKSPLDDIKEGKRTVLVAYALEHADKADKNFLLQCLGNESLTIAEFTRCKEILTETGAYDHARQLAAQYIDQAQASLAKHSELWTKDGVSFLHSLAQYMLIRTN